MSIQLSPLLSFAHVVVVLAISLRVIMRRPPAGVALAWMFLVAFLPLVGPVLYLLIGERRVGCSSMPGGSPCSVATMPSWPRR